MTNLPPSRTAPKIMLRLPAGLKDHLTELAAANGRSVNAQVIALIEAALEVEEMESALEDRVERLESQMREFMQKAGIDSGA